MKYAATAIPLSRHRSVLATQSLEILAIWWNHCGLRDPHTFAIIGAAMAVHTELGCGFLELVYRNAMTVELEERCIPFRTEVPFPLSYKQRRLPLNYRVDLVCFQSVVVEIKALKAIGPIEQAQAINYLKASSLPCGLILNFGARSLKYRRVVLSLGAVV